MGFIEQWEDLLSRITDAPKAFAHASGLFLISTFAERNFFYLSKPDVSFKKQSYKFGVLLNLPFIFIGKSRVTRKSTVIDKVSDIIEEILPDIILPQDMTPQAFVSEMYKKCQGVPGFEKTHAVWITDEISGFFEQLSKRAGSYMTGFDTVLCILLDGRNYVKTTIKRQREAIYSPYLTVLVASTDYLPTLFTEGSLRQGMLNRFIIIPAERKQWKESTPSGLTAEERNQLEEIKIWLQVLYEQGEITLISPAFDAKPLINEFEKNIEDQINQKTLGIKEGYYGNLPNIVRKLSSIYRLSRLSKEELSTGMKLLHVEKQDVEKAIAYANQMKIWIDKVIELMMTRQEILPIRTMESQFMYIISIIREQGKTYTDVNGKKYPKSIRWTDLLTTSKMGRRQLWEIIDNLIRINKIRIHYKVDFGKRGPKTALIQLL